MRVRFCEDEDERGRIFEFMEARICPLREVFVTATMGRAAVWYLLDFKFEIFGLGLFVGLNC